jgi:predicted ABC-type sugar transport system permease subunit
LITALDHQLPEIGDAHQRHAVIQGGDNQRANQRTGNGVLIFVYGMSGLLSGLGGLMSASRLYSANGNLGVGK